MSNRDISYCGSDCKNKECYRHGTNAPKDVIYLSWADFSPYCDKYIPKGGDDE